jgi:hypothetical protein
MKQSLPNPAPQILNTDTKLHRYWNLRSIVEAASVTIVAEMMGVQTPRVTAIAGPNPVRAIGDATAASIEKTFSLKPGAIDAKPDRHALSDDESIAEVALIMSTASVADKVLISGLAKTVVGHTVKTIREIEKNGCDRLITSEQINELLAIKESNQPEFQQQKEETWQQQ